MVTQRDAEQSPQSLEAEPDGLDDFRVVDSTPPEQLEVEAELDSELEQPEAAQVAEVDGEQITVGRDTERQVQPVAEPQAEEEPVAQVDEPAAQPPVRQYSPDEVAKMQSAWMRQVQEAQDAARKATEARDLETEVEARLRQLQEQLTPQYGEEEARKLARSHTNEQVVRAEVSLRQENQRLQQRIQQSEQMQEENAKTIVAQQLMETYGLQTDDYSLLLATPKPAVMQALAKRLANQTLQTRKQEQARKAAVPAETSETTLTNGQSNGAAPESYERQLARIRQKPSWEWTDAEHDFMRR